MMTMAELLDRMAAGGELGDGARDAIGAALAGRGRDTTPWYLHLLVGVGSLVAALLLLAFFGMANLLDSSGVMVTTGLVLCGGAALARLALDRTGVLHQAPLAPALAGALMVWIGIWSSGGGFLSGTGDRSTSLALAGLAALELGMIFAYRDRLHRFLATVVVCMAVCLLLLNNDLHLAAALLAVALGWAATLAWQHESLLARREELARPVLYGLTMGLFAVIWALLLEQDTLDWVVSVGLGAALAHQAWRLLAGAAPRARALGVAGALLLLPLAWGSPGLLAAPLIILVGFSRGSRIVVGLGALFLASYIIFFYYNLELTLLAKSFSLLGVGAALLGARAALARARVL
ncbi:MAG TPA: DUF4401 domain-containing protein [Chloroflexaceae bacterium]|nr:DUF4401 domain-containing protein [Chloroflexaceae bacterium]